MQRSYRNMYSMYKIVVGSEEVLYGHHVLGNRVYTQYVMSPTVFRNVI